MDLVNFPQVLKEIYKYILAFKSVVDSAKSFIEFATVCFLIHKGQITVALST